jgi:hypothetical protein
MARSRAAGRLYALNLAENSSARRLRNGSIPVVSRAGITRLILSAGTFRPEVEPTPSWGAAKRQRGGGTSFVAVADDDREQETGTTDGSSHGAALWKAGTA